MLAVASFIIQTLLRDTILGGNAACSFEQDIMPVTLSEMFIPQCNFSAGVWVIWPLKFPFLFKYLLLL